jgi:hypothetical protein
MASGLRVAAPPQDSAGGGDDGFDHAFLTSQNQGSGPFTTPSTFVRHA